jgi:hypothetical protein
METRLRLRRWWLSLWRLDECPRCGGISDSKRHGIDQCPVRVYALLKTEMDEQVARLDKDDNGIWNGLQDQITALELHSDTVAGKATDAYNHAESAHNRADSVLELLVERSNKLAEMWEEQTEIKEGQVTALIETCAENKRIVLRLTRRFNEQFLKKAVDFGRATSSPNAEQRLDPSVNPHNYASPIALLQKCLPHLDTAISEHNDGKRLHRAICEYLREEGYHGAFNVYYKGGQGNSAKT